MTGPPVPYAGREELRAEAVHDMTTVNGIDLLEFGPGPDRLDVHFIHPLPGQLGGIPVDGAVLNRTRLVIQGGDRLHDLRVGRPRPPATC